MTLTALTVLGLFGLVGGIGITALGPGGVLPTVGLFALTGLSPTTVAGTAIVTHVATGALGTAAYMRSGQLLETETRRTALILCGTAAIGTPAGVYANTLVSPRVFGFVLGGFVAVVAALLWYRERGDPACRAHPRLGPAVALGLFVAAASGMVGIGGPMLTVPLLCAAGVPVLEALASAQAQSVVIATVGTVGYLTQGAVDWKLAAVIGIPELIGVLIGWRIAHAVPARQLKAVLIVLLFALAPYLALHG